MKKSLTITFSTDAFETLRGAMDDGGILEKPVMVSVKCVRGVWVVEPTERAIKGGVTLPVGYDTDAIVGLLEGVICETHADGYGKGWRMPPLSTAYLCDDGKMRTVGQMLEGISIELMPHDEVSFHTLLFTFGVDWTHPLMPTMQPYGIL